MEYAISLPAVFTPEPVCHKTLPTGIKPAARDVDTDEADHTQRHVRTEESTSEQNAGERTVQSRSPYEKCSRICIIGEVSHPGLRVLGHFATTISLAGPPQAACAVQNYDDTGLQ